MNILMHNYFRFRNTLQISNNSLLNHSYLNLPDLILFPTNEFLKNNSISFNPRVTEKIHTCMHKLSLKMRLYCRYAPRTMLWLVMATQSKAYNTQPLCHRL